jgi:predicted pyridoxine 5'-phosphate oxidase superfamily flavin-nucleotide-binding protein
MDSSISDIAFTPAVKARQTEKGSREIYAKQISKRDWQDRVTDDLAAFLAKRDSFYMATVSQDGHPYIQHRGGPRGFLRVIDEQTLAFADFSGNRQYISMGNLDGNDRVHLFLMDYANRQRIKVWGRAKVVEDDPGLMEELVDPAYKARPERAFVIAIEAWDVNCPQHIPELHGEDTIRAVTAKLTQRIAELEAENAELKGWMGKD